MAMIAISPTPWMTVNRSSLLSACDAGCILISAIDWLFDSSRGGPPMLSLRRR